MTRTKSLYLALLAVLLSPMAANADLISFGDRATFEAAGTISEFQDFESFNNNIFTFPGNPWVDGSVTYTTGSNLIVGSNTFINPVSNTFSNDSFGASVQGDIIGTFNMLAFDMAVNDSGVVPPTGLTLFTNLGSYNFDFDLPDVQIDQLFQGWIAMSGEYFTGFSFEADNFVHIDNITLGTAAAVPEPATLALLGIGLLGLGLSRRKKV